MLVVGDPNFSFSYTMARRLGSAEGLVCTDQSMNACVRDTHQHYLIPLFEMGATVCARVDATRLGKHCLVRRCGQYFDHVVWNFPFATTPANRLPKMVEEYRTQLKRFLSQAELVCVKGGRCAITIKDGEHDEWEVHNLNQGKMQFIGAESFTAAKFPTYNHVGTKNGAQFTGAFSFPQARTYVFAMLGS